MKKKCCKCKEDRPVSEFPARKQSKDGLDHYCRSCHNANCRARYARNKYGVDDPKYISSLLTEEVVNSVKTCRICDEEKPKEEFVKRGNSIDGYRKICLVCHRKEQSIREKKWRASNHRQRLSKYVSHQVWKSLKGGKSGKRWQSLVGYSLDDLMQHLQPLFKEGMSWENYGDWHIDHICPVSSFAITSYDCSAFQECWSLQNLQPLWAIDNKKKYNKHQPLC